jgi:hypothetical protein
MRDGEIGGRPGPAGDRRVFTDRRKPYLLSDWRYAFGGRRRAVRRVGDEATAGIDHYSPRIIALILAISLMNALDAIFTIRLVDSGAGEEWNPVMRALLERDVQLFANLKVAITSGSLIFLVVCSQMAVLNRRVRVERLMHVMLVAYLALMVYHFALLKLASA